MENVRKCLPYALGVLIVWMGLDSAVRIYEAYEAVCSKDIYLGCKSISNDIILLRVIIVVCAVTAGYAFSKYLVWSKVDQEQQRQRGAEHR